ncbi:angiopoietin-related protein 1-like [Patiria miniata]|uniref:Fibrinogen C-terminal domain-containing protein n=1 Tax=Patiria miniata TaxID=46514 RepID=A0A914ACR2_PATMI|nr:angiopoietin-related protein 1-like [Patiria miniata]
MDERCKSFNFNDCSKLCELNLATRREHPDNFNTTQGSVYFDADEDGYRSCKMLLHARYHSSGIYTIYPEGFGNGGLRVYCDMETDGGGWIVFQRRQDASVDFYRNWAEYQSGFGDLSGEFWLGNDNLVTVTSDDSRGPWELRVDLEDWVGYTAWAKYSDFQISPGEYNLNIGQYDASSTAGDSLGYQTDPKWIHRGRPFTTKDRDNDAARHNCAQQLVLRSQRGIQVIETIAKRIINGLELFHIISIIICQGATLSVSGFETSYTEKHTFYAAENRALKEFGYMTKLVRSRVICGRECSMDERCKSFNFNDCNKMCELNLATRREHPEDFNATQGSVYFDADEDTPLYSLTDSSFNRYRSCKMLLDAGYRSSGIYTIYPEGFGNCGLRVYCDMETDGGGWIVFQRRQDGSVDFYRNWAEYQSGFGDLSGEFWLGNDNLVTLTSDDSRGTWELRVDLEDWENNTAWAKYADFQISPGEYNLNIGQYDASSTAGDSLGYQIPARAHQDHRGQPFTTKDRDNDAANHNNCAQMHTGAWWFKGCFFSHLNGQYYPDENTGSNKGVQWFAWHLHYSLKACSMKMREIGP